MTSRHLLRLIGGGAVASLLAAFSLHAATLPAGFTEVQLASAPDATAMAFSPDGRLVLTQGTNCVCEVATGERVATLPGDLYIRAAAFSRDGRFLLFRSFDPEFGVDIWAMPMTGDRKPFVVVRTKFDERDARFSPDGR